MKLQSFNSSREASQTTSVSRWFSRHPRWLPIALAVYLTATATSCTTTYIEAPISHDPLEHVSQKSTYTLQLLQGVEDLRKDTSRIGRATVTLFAFTSGTVQPEMPLDESIVVQVVQALESAGYEVELVDSLSSSVKRWPTLSISIRKFSFTNYSWLKPFYLSTWGSVELELTLRDRRGDAIVRREITAGGRSSCKTEECGFRHAIREAMTDALNQVVAASVAPDFRAVFADVSD